MLSTGLVLEVLLFGGAIVWLVALIPAAVVCIRNREWAGFAAGWLTFGVAWIACALALLPRRYAIRTLTLAAGAIVVLGALAARPTPIIGLDGDALDNSVGGNMLSIESGPCEHLQAARWRLCHV